MIIALVLVYLFFIVKSEGRMFLPQNVNNLIMQNSYVVILAVGMLLASSPVVTLTSPSAQRSASLARSPVFFDSQHGVEYLPCHGHLPSDRYRHRRLAGLLDRLCACPAIHPSPSRACFSSAVLRELSSAERRSPVSPRNILRSSTTTSISPRLTAAP